MVVSFQKANLMSRQYQTLLDSVYRLLLMVNHTGIAGVLSIYVLLDEVSFPPLSCSVMFLFFPDVTFVLASLFCNLRCSVMS